MPIIVTNQGFQDMFGTTRSYLKSNVGDIQTASIDIKEEISVTSGNGITITNNASSNIITWLGGDFEEEGFRATDSVILTIYNVNTGAVTSTTTTTIDYVIGDTMKVASTSSTWYTLPDEVVSIVTLRARESMTLNVNMVANGSAGSEFSLIDGEVTRFNFDFTGGGTSFTGVQIGNKSGSYDVTATMSLTPNPGSSIRDYTLRISFTQVGLYNSNLFDFNNCVKLYAGMSWSSLSGEPFGQTMDVFNDDADTGWFNQGFNSSVIDATLVQSIGSLAYDSVTTGQFVIDSASNDYAVGSAYISGSDSYYKVQPQSQANLTMLVPSSLPISGVPNQSALNPDGAGYTIEITNIATVGTIRTIDFTFTPNTAFTTFMTNRTEGDRTFYVWMKFGNVNVLAFSGQLSSAPVVAGTINMNATNYIDHGQNTIADQDTSLSVTGYSGNVEDDFGFVAKWLWIKKAIVTYVRVGVEAYNSVTEESFTLQQSNFSLNNIPQTGPLDAYVLNLTAPINTELPTTSNKIEAILINDNSINTPTEYGVRLYYPYLYNWRYWIAQANADGDFYPDQQTQNWVPYGTTGTWGLRTFVEYNLNGSAYRYTDDLTILDYDSDANIVQDIQLKRNDPLTNVNVIIEGEMMRVVATHTITSGTWKQTDIWGMITIEPTESSPRYISSTAIDYDGDLSNPLTPLSGLRCDLTFPSPNIARLECFFDPTKINLNNGVKFTTKIKGCIWP